MFINHSDAERKQPATQLNEVESGPRALSGELELVEFAPPQRSFSTPVLFLHGALGGAWSWCDGFGQRFAAAGFHAYALSARAHGGSSRGQPLDVTGLSHYVEDVRWAVQKIGAVPALVAHSMGGLVAQKFLEEAHARALALLAPLPPQGIVPVMLLVALRHPRVFAEVNLFVHTGRATMEGLRQALFAAPVPVDRLQRYLAFLQRESLRALWDAAFFDLPRPWRIRGRLPMLVLAGEKDALVPPEMAQLCASTLAAPYEAFPGMGHAMMLEAGWEKVADRLVHWLRGVCR